MNENLMNKKIKLCFISLNSYPLLKNDKEKNYEYVGGAEKQQVQLAKEFKKRGYQISFITYGEKSNRTEIIDEIEIHPVYERSKVQKLNLFIKAVNLAKTMRSIDADIYFYRSGSPGIISAFCRLTQKKVIYLISSDAVVSGESIINKGLLKIFFEKFAHFLDIKLANIVVAQNNFQKLKLKKKFHVDSPIIKNSIYLDTPYKNIQKNEYLIWIGTIRSVKQPELLLKLAQYFPTQNFIMIGGKGEDLNFFNKIKNEAKTIKNIEFKGFVPPEEINTYYQKAILLINTSKTEGFPNIFLEAWSQSIPVISLNIDPDGVISKFHLGYYSKNFDQLIRDVSTLLNDNDLKKTLGHNGRKYVEENHDIQKIVDQYENLLETFLKRHKGA